VFVGRARENRTPARKGFAFVSLVAKGRNAVGMVAAVFVGRVGGSQTYVRMGLAVSLPVKGRNAALTVAGVFVVFVKSIMDAALPLRVSLWKRVRLLAMSVEKSRRFRNSIVVCVRACKMPALIM